MRKLGTLAALIVGLALAELLVPGKARASLLGDEIFASGLNLIPPSAIVRDEPPEEAPGFVEFTGVNGLSGPQGAVQIDFDGDNSLTISTNGVSWCCGFGDYVFSDLDFLDGNIITGFSLVSNVGFSTEGSQRTTFLTEFSFTADSITLNFDKGGTLNEVNAARFLIETGQIPGALSVSPTSGLIASGDEGGPFSPPSQSYTLMNTGGSSIVFDVSKGKSWVSLSKTGGTLLAGASTSVLVAINSSAALLNPGVHSDTVSFTNTTNGQGNTSRSVSLTVNAPPMPWIGLLLLDD